MTTVDHAADVLRVVDMVDDAGDVPLARLRADVAARDVFLGSVTDEVLLLCGREPLAGPRAHWTPWLSGRAPDAVDAARDATRRWLLANGLLEHHGGRVELRQPLATLGWALDAAVGVVTWTTQVDPRGLRRGDATRASGALVVLPGGLVLRDTIHAEAGVHELWFCRHEVAATWVAAALDPDACADVTRRPAVTTDLSDLDAAVAALPGRPRSRTVMAAADGSDDRALLRTVTALGTTRGLWLAQARRGDEPAGVLQAVGEQDLLVVGAALLEPAGPAGGVASS